MFFFLAHGRGSVQKLVMLLTITVAYSNEFQLSLKSRYHTYLQVDNKQNDLNLYASCISPTLLSDTIDL